jgi:hypothetical protein
MPNCFIEICRGEMEALFSQERRRNEIASLYIRQPELIQIRAYSERCFPKTHWNGLEETYIDLKELKDCSTLLWDCI